MIEVKSYAEITEKTKLELDGYINDEFGNIAIVNETKWATPDWTIIIHHDNKIASFYNIIERNVTVDHKSFRAAGINNVITLPDFRGKGFSSKLLKATEGFIFDKLNCDLALLLCADDLIPFYSRLNWYKVDCPIYFKQPTGQKLWQANTMLLTRGELITPSEINLNGYPW